MRTMTLSGWRNGIHRAVFGAGEEADIFDAYHQAFKSDHFGIRTISGQETSEMFGECGLWWRAKAVGNKLRYMLFENWWGQGLTGDEARALVWRKSRKIIAPFQFSEVTVSKKTICRDANLKTGRKELVIVALCNSM